jgi:hypothetical protein
MAPCVSTLLFFVQYTVPICFDAPKKNNSIADTHSELATIITFLTGIVRLFCCDKNNQFAML